MGIQDGRDFLSLSQSEIEAASILLGTGNQYHNVCFHAREAAELAVKAVLLASGFIRRSRPDFPAFAEASAVLDQDSSVARYQRHLREGILAEEAEQALSYAQEIRHAAQTVIDAMT